MAKVAFGGGVSNMQGSIGGNTFTRTKGGTAARNKAKPTNPGTPAQMAQRARIVRMSKEWQSMTDAERTAWDSQAGQVSVTGVCGQGVTLTGHQLYVKTNSNREDSGDTTTASTPPSAAQWTADIFGDNDDTAAYIATAQILIPLGSGAAADQVIKIYATTARSPGKTAYKSNLKAILVHTIVADDVTAGNINVGSNWISTFGSMTGALNKAITFSCREYGEGLYSPPTILKCTVAAA